MFKVCAIICVFNEIDVIRECVEKLIVNEVDVYVLDNGSTDGSMSAIEDLLGHGLIAITPVEFLEDGQTVFNLSYLMRCKEQIAKSLNYDWYINVDSDEIRYSPWHDINLRAALEKVDQLGYTLVNFKLFNFRMIQDTTRTTSIEDELKFYSLPGFHDINQVRAWKSHPAIELASTGGHITSRPDSRVFPIRFILKHYPIRSIAHGIRKLTTERKARFSPTERRKGWHIQYDDIDENAISNLIWNKADLTEFDFEKERRSLVAEGAEVMATVISNTSSQLIREHYDQCILDKFNRAGFTPQHNQALMGIAHNLLQMAAQKSLPPLAVGERDAEFLQYATRALAAESYLRGQLNAYAALENISYKID